MIGDDLVTQIVDDGLQGQEMEFRTALGGFNFDLAPYIDTIVHGTSLLVTLVHIYTMRGHMPPPDTPDSTEEAMVEILAKTGAAERDMELGKATKLARLFMRIVSGR